MGYDIDTCTYGTKAVTIFRQPDPREKLQGPPKHQTLISLTRVYKTPHCSSHLLPLTFPPFSLLSSPSLNPLYYPHLSIKESTHGVRSTPGPKMLIPRNILLLLFPYLALAHPTLCPLPCTPGTETQISATATTTPHEKPSYTSVADSSSAQLPEPASQTPAPRFCPTCARNARVPGHVNSKWDEEPPNSSEELTQPLHKRGNVSSKISKSFKKLKMKMKKWMGMGKGGEQRGWKWKQKQKQRQRRKKQKQKQNRKQEQKKRPKTNKPPPKPFLTGLGEDIPLMEWWWELRLDRRQTGEGSEDLNLAKLKDGLKDGEDKQKQEAQTQPKMFATILDPID